MLYLPMRCEATSTKLCLSKQRWYGFIFENQFCFHYGNRKCENVSDEYISWKGHRNCCYAKGVVCRNVIVQALHVKYGMEFNWIFVCKFVSGKMYPNPFWQYHSCRHTYTFAHSRKFDTRSKNWHIGGGGGLVWTMKSQTFRDWQIGKQNSYMFRAIKSFGHGMRVIHHSNTVSDTHAIQSVSESVHSNK